MSNAPGVRRTDKLMSDEDIRALLTRGYAGRVATAGPDGFPYVTPLLFVWQEGEVWIHNTSAHGHFRANVDFEPRVCFEVDEPGPVFPYGRFECDTSVAYRSVVAFGTIRVVEDRARKAAFFDAFMLKYANPDWRRRRSFYPRLDDVTVYAIAVQRLTGKETPLPPAEGLWPNIDGTKSPDAGP